MKNLNSRTLTRNELKAVLGGAEEVSQFEPQDCYCVTGGISFGCVTDAMCDSTTQSLCPTGVSICITR